MAKPNDPVESAEQRPAWAWIDEAALRHNARRALECAEGRSVIGVVKADGYGHGAAAVARVLLAEGVDRLAIVSVAEGAALRREGIVAPILLLGGLDDEACAARAVKWDLTPVLQDERGLALADRFGLSGSKRSVEIEVDTGMSRMGVVAGSAVALVERARRSPGLQVTGLFTHLACSDTPDPEPSRRQIARFAEVVGELGRGDAGLDGESLAIHVVNSGGLLRRQELERPELGLVTTAVRPGLMLYGASPFEIGADGEGGRSAEALDLEPVMTLAARVISIRRLAEGEAVGYGSEWRAPAPTTIATLPLGYADGIPRSVLGRGQVHLAGKLRSIVGRVSMDSVCIDVGDAPVAIGDIATIFGRTPAGERVPVEGLAAAAGTVAYEILVGVGARVPRLVGAGRPPGAGQHDLRRTD